MGYYNSLFGIYISSDDEYQRKEEKEVKKEKTSKRKPTPYERTRDTVYATGNKWAIENFNATHWKENELWKELIMQCKVYGELIGKCY